MACELCLFKNVYRNWGSCCVCVYFVGEENDDKFKKFTQSSRPVYNGNKNQIQSCNSIGISSMPNVRLRA